MLGVLTLKIHSQQLLGVTIDRELNFHDHLSNLCKT